MVTKARRIVEDLGGQIANLGEARQIVGLTTPASSTRAA
jgi:hypothetical protein